MTPPPSQDRLLKHVVTRALTSPPSLFMGATGVLLALSPVAWPAGVAVLTFQVGWVWLRIRDPRHARASLEEGVRRRWMAQINRLEELASVLDRDTAGVLSAIVESEERLLALYGEQAPFLIHGQTQLTSLLEHSLSLAEKRHQVQTYLAAHRAQDIQRQVYQLQLRAEQSADDVTRRLYEQAIEQKREELENYACLEEASRRIDGQLAAVQCTFDNMVGRLVRLRSADSVLADPASDPVFAELQELTNGVAALEGSINEILLLRGGA